MGLKEPIDDGIPVFRLGIVERGVVGAGRENYQVSASPSAVVEFAGHVRLEETVAVALDDEDGESAIAERFLGRPDRRD